LVWAGAGFLGWIAGEMLVADDAAMAYLPGHPSEWIVAALCAALVLAAGWLLTRRREEAHQGP